MVQPATAAITSRERTKDTLTMISTMTICLQQVMLHSSITDNLRKLLTEGLADELEFKDIDILDPVSRSSAVGASVLHSNRKEGGRDWKPQRLENGKWACNHKCRDKTV